MNENEIATLALDICFKIHRKFGPGLYESVYEEVFCYELDKYEINYERQLKIPLIHEGIEIGSGFKADIIIEKKVIIEFKSVEELDRIYFRQLTTYLKLTNIKLGLLINFNVVLMKDGIHRIANGL
jgi:GxxExxY protein